MYVCVCETEYYTCMCVCTPITYPSWLTLGAVIFSAGELKASVCTHFCNNSSHRQVTVICMHILSDIVISL